VTVIIGTNSSKKKESPSEFKHQGFDGFGIMSKDPLKKKKKKKKKKRQNKRKKDKEKKKNHT